MFRLNYLRPLQGNATKTFVFENGEWKVGAGYRAGKFFDGFSYSVGDLSAAFEIIKKYQNHPMFLIQGDFIPGANLKQMRRIKRADRDGMPPTLQDRELQLVCFDVDGFKANGEGLAAIDEFIVELPGEFWESDYIYQFSASYGLTTSELKCHLFFWLDKPAPSRDIRHWIIEYNKEKEWGNVLDPAIFVATQPIYTQRRICSGAPDPIQNFIGLVKKSGVLEWSPPEAPAPASLAPRSSSSAEKYSMPNGIQRILSGQNFHEEINKLSLSLMAKGIAGGEIQSTIRGIMLAARANIANDSKRLQDWQTRYDDIERSVDSAFKMVQNPNQGDLIKWIESAPIEVVLKDFPGKTFKKPDEELTEIIEKISARSSVTKRELRKRVKGFQDKYEHAATKDKRKALFLDRKKRKIFEVPLDKHNLYKAAQQVTKILSRSHRWPPVFFYGPGLVYVDFANLTTIRQVKRFSEAKINKTKYCRMPAILPFRKPYHDLIARMGRDIRFVKYPMGKEIQCPEKLASVVALGLSERHRDLTGIVQSPFITVDWELFCKKGYDPDTGLYSVIDDKPPQNYLDPKAAYEFLTKEVLAEFSFKEDLDAAVMVSSMMALLQRPLLAQDPAGMPGFGIVAPVQSSGKTTLVNVVTTAVLKTTVPPSNFSKDDEELNKHILAVLREGHNCVLFDNITEGADVNSDVLSKAMSSEVYSGRLLGENRTVSVASAAIWFFTGNNIKFPGDFSTRVYPVTLNPKMENPDTRSYARNILDWILEHRTDIIWSLISIIKAGQNLPPMDTSSRFKLWDTFIRNPLYHASGIDINRAILSNKNEDVDFTNKRALIKEIRETYEDISFTSRALRAAGFPEGEGVKPTAIGEILEDILGPKYSRSPKSIGKLLGKMVGRAYGNLTLNREDTDRAYWTVSKLD